MYGIRGFQFVIVVIGMILGGMEGCFGNNTPHTCPYVSTDMIIAEIGDMMEDLRQMKPKLQAECDLISGCKCLVIRLSSAPLLKNASQTLCANFGGKLADIETEEQFNDLLAYLPEFEFYGSLWTGMRYVNHQLVLSDGTPSLYRWNSRTDDEGLTEMVILTNEDQSKYMNLGLDQKAAGYICEIY